MHRTAFPATPGKELTLPREVPRTPARPPARSRWAWVAAVAGVLVAAIVAVEVIPEALAPAPPPAVRTAMVRSGVVEQSIRLTGNTTAERAAQLRAPYLRGRRSTGAGDFGLVLQRLAPPGAKVKAGDIVAAFDPLNMVNRLDNNRADRQDTEFEADQLRAEIQIRQAARAQQIRVAEGNKEKAAVELKTLPVRSAIQGALLQLAYEEAAALHASLLRQEPYARTSDQAELRVVELERDEEIVEERRAELNVERMTVRAPMSGLVVIPEIYRGGEMTAVRAGDQIRPGQPYLQIVDTSSMIVEATANQADAGLLKIGLPARVRFDGEPDREFEGRVRSVGPLARGSRFRGDFVSTTPVFISIEDRDTSLIPNLTMSADVIVHSEPSDAIVPREAIFDLQSDGRGVLYVREGAEWEEREVEVGLTNHVEAAILSGVQPGEIVALEQPAS